MGSFSFAGYSSLHWQLWSFRTWSALLQALLTFRVSVKKSTVILIDFLLYVPCIFFSFSFQAYFFVLYDVLTVICCGVFLFWSHLFSVLWASCSCAVYRLQNKSPHFCYYSLLSCLRPRHLVSCLSWKKVLLSFHSRINCPSVLQSFCHTVLTLISHTSTHILQ